MRNVLDHNYFDIDLDIGYIHMEASIKAIRKSNYFFMQSEYRKVHAFYLNYHLYHPQTMYKLFPFRYDGGITV